MSTRRFAAHRGLLGGLLAFALFAASAIGITTAGTINSAGSPAQPVLTAQATVHRATTQPALTPTVKVNHEHDNDRHHR
ncbi:MAG: hypothetical protein QOH12_1105 [Solirubrobacteraceae bacterium]|jgi:hypothetical protein|nr:hypothetical protein [Solirubrobacteraceae bacterium]